MFNLKQHFVRYFWLVFLLLSTGCRSFVESQAMKNYPVHVTSPKDLPTPNQYQQDFLYLATLADDVFPLEDRYFPPDKRAVLQRRILGELGQPACTYKTFDLCIQEYLNAFNCQHAYIMDDPKPAQFNGLYPFEVHYFSNDLYIADISSNYDRSLIGQKIIAINDRPISDVEQKLFRFASGENLWTLRSSLESPPSPYSEPELYQRAGLTSAITNTVKLTLAGHAPVSIAPVFKNNIHLQLPDRAPDPLTGRSDHQYDCHIFAPQHFAYLQFNACFDKIAILDGLSMVKPWIRPLVRAWLAIEFRRSKPSGILSGLYDPERPVFKDYLAATIDDINRAGITNLIIDLRYNGGGETELTYQLIYFLTHRTDLLDARSFEYNPKVSAYYDPKEGSDFRTWYLKKFDAEPPMKRLSPTPDQERPFFYPITDPSSPYYISPDRPVFEGNVVVLANQDTGSAASLLTGILQDNHLATIVGATTGNNPTGPTVMTPFQLPRSRILFSLPTEYDERAWPENGNILQPDYWAENSVADTVAARDAAFEKALDVLHLGGAISTVRVNDAEDFLWKLNKKGGQPGWSKNDYGTIDLEAYGEVITFSLHKNSERRALYHYTVAQHIKDGPWILQRAWRSDRHGKVLIEYPVQ